MLLLALCIGATSFGTVLIFSATRFQGTMKNTFIQIFAMLIGIVLYIVFSVIDLEILAERQTFLLLFDIGMIALLFLFGEAGDSGNKAWIRFGGIGIQPAEIVKIPYTIVLAKQITTYRERRGINHPVSIFWLAAHFLLMFGLIIVASSDLGSALVYAFIFVVLLFVGGVKWYWFVGAFSAIAAITPYAWNHLLTNNQKNRILAPYVTSVDPTGLGITWQPMQAKAAIASGEFWGQGLLHGAKTQTGGIPQQHTDFILGVAGEELGFVGCMAIIVVLALIIIRCIHVGLRCNNRLGMLVCYGIASMLIFQTLENVGMCLGLTPVIGLTLPFFSYGGSSIITLFAAMGIVSGVRMHRNPSIFWMGSVEKH